MCVALMCMCGVCVIEHAPACGDGRPVALAASAAVELAAIRRAAAAAAASARLALLPVVMVRTLVGRGVGVLVLLACLVLGSARRWCWLPIEMKPSPGCGWGESLQPRTGLR